MRIVRTLRGYRPLCFIKDGLLFSKGFKLYTSDLDGAHLRQVATVPHAALRWLTVRLRWTARLLRCGVTLGCALPNNRCLLCAGREIWLFDLDTGRLTLDYRPIHRPLTLSYFQDIPGFADGVYFGDYTGNPSQEPVAIHHRDAAGQWSQLHAFPNQSINHIHAVVPDRESGLAWILTGDFGEGTGIWRAKEGFRTVIPFAANNQEFRSTWAYANGPNLIYGMDSQYERNFICRIPKEAGPGHPEKLFPLAGSCIYSCQSGDLLVFSTAVEPGLPSGSHLKDLFDRTPGPGILGSHATLVAGNETKGFQQIGSWKKDPLPMVLFQFGSISFPTGKNPTDRVFAYGTGLSGFDGTTLVIDALEP